jgi:GTPase SAR1 family protein
VLVFDLTNAESFTRLVGWIDIIKKAYKDTDVPFILLGNKSDLPTRAVRHDHIQQLLGSYVNMTYIEARYLMPNMAKSDM